MAVYAVKNLSCFISCFVLLQYFEQARHTCPECERILVS